MLRNVYEYVKDNEFRFTVYNNRIHIVNYIRIDFLTNNELLIIGDDSKIKIKGNNLVLNKLLNKEILIIGKVYSIEVIYE